MTLKNKLIANVLFTAAIIIAISAASFLSMRFLQEKLSYLTEKSTPFQIGTLELQRELQGAIASLLKVNAAQTISEYSVYRSEAEKSLNNVMKARTALDKISTDTAGTTDELDKIALELFASVEDRINSSNAATTANTKALRSMKESSSRLSDLDSSIRTMQSNYSKSFAAALENTGISTSRSRSIEELRNRIRDLQLIAVSVQNANNPSTALLAKGKLKAVAVRISKNAYYKSNPSIAVITAGFTDKLAEFIKLQADAIALKNDDAKNRAAASGIDITYKLNDLFQTLDQENILARDDLAFAYNKQGSIFAQTNSANRILVANSELVALGLRITSETNRLFTVESIVELDKREALIRPMFSKIDERVLFLERSLTKLNAGEELKMLREAAASITGIRTEIFSSNGIVTALKMKLSAIEQSVKSDDRLHMIVIKQSEQGNKSVLIAQGEQEKAIVSVYAMIKRSLTLIVSISLVAIVIGILFGFWIFRSVLLPLRVILDAVSRQHEQVQEKASLAEAVAGGDLNQEVTVSEAMVLDPGQVQQDEMGMVLNAVVGMSVAQVTLDNAFAGMTTSLRNSRDDETRRNRLKSGLYELNKILRIEQKSTELGDKTLSFLVEFLDAGVGIFYLYEETESKLVTLSTYAISRSERLNNGFRLGEGLPGQVALKLKMISINSVPSDYLLISSALGKSGNLNVAVMPIMHNETLVGVLELGSFKKFSDDDFEFLTQSLEGIAIAISVNHSHQQVNELLEQTQAQSEELRVQQEELQHTNEELVEQAREIKQRRRSKVGSA